MTEATKRSIFRWVHIICGIPILGYIYDSPSDTTTTPPVFGMSFFLYCSFQGFGCGKAMSFADLLREIGPTKCSREPLAASPAKAWGSRFGL